MAQSPAERQKTWRRRHPDRARAVGKAAAQKWRDAAKAKAKSPTIHYNDLPADQAGALCEWAKDKLKIPPGHLHEGQPFDIPDYGQRFIKDALAEGCKDALFCCARKNSKTGISALIVLGHMGNGPLARPGFRAGCASTSRIKAGELRAAIESTARASGLDDIQFWRRSSNAITAENGSVDVLAADANSGAAAGYNLVLIDELGLLQERDRPLVTSLRSSLSAKRGRMICLSIYGSGPFVGEYLDRQDDEAVTVHLYQPPADSKIDDEAAWHLANPGLASGIKSIDSMRLLSRAAIACPSDQAEFRSQEMNLPGSPSREMVCAPPDWSACVVPVAELPARSGPCFVGLDAGGSSSMTAAAAYWPQTKRLELFAAFPATPNLVDRGQADGCGGIYREAWDRQELMTYTGRVTPVGDFTRHVAASLAGCEVVGAASDRYRRSEIQQVIESEEIVWRWDWRGMGSGMTGSADVRSFQRAILRGEIRTIPSLLMPLALKSTVLRRDSNGNPSLERGNTGRIDVLSACVLAIGLAAETSSAPRLTITRTPF